jgi:hypothetical protein
VLFINIEVRQRYDSSVFEILNDCGVQVIDLGDCPYRDLTNDFLRQIVYFEFLVANRFMINRVISSDLFDTVFQKDPFTDKFATDRVYYSSEAIGFSNNVHNLRWVNQFIAKSSIIFPGLKFTKEQTAAIEKRVIVCCGLVAGGLEPMIRHCRLMLRMGDLERLISFGADQGFLNFVLAAGLTDFKYQIDPPNETFLSSYGVHLSFDPNAFGSTFGAMGRFGRVYNIVQGGDRSPLVLNAIVKACPQLNASFQDSVRAGYLRIRRRSGNPAWIFSETVP